MNGYRADIGYCIPATVSACSRFDWGLDTEAEVYVLLVAGVRIEVVGSAAVELIALADFAAHEEPERDGSQTSGDPADGPQKR